MTMAFRLPPLFPIRPPVPLPSRPKPPLTPRKEEA